MQISKKLLICSNKYFKLLQSLSDRFEDIGYFVILKQ